jgi:8-oxo-dGTP pyrophosphatase MutT (NUDIX family)
MKLLATLRKELCNALPGLEYQLRMAPENRPQINNNSKKRNAAVAILILDDPHSGDREIVLIKRPEYEGPHSGQISFPGGKQEISDNNLIHTAIRECYEEIGILLHEEKLAGSLTPLFIPVSNFLVHPFVFVYNEVPFFVTEKEEVSYVIRFPLSGLFDEALRRETVMSFRGNDFLVPYYAINDEFVWGATAMILSEFIEILKNIENKNPGVL